MDRFVHLALGVLLGASSSAGLAAPSSAADQLPSADDYPTAEARCRIKRTLYAHVSSRAVVFGKTVECSLLVYSCRPNPRLYRSEARPTKQDVCGDYYATAAALSGRRICCDKAEPDPEKEPQRESKPGAEQPPPRGGTSPDEGEKRPGGAALQADLAARVQAPARYPVGATPFAVIVVNNGPDPAAAVRLIGSITQGTLTSATTARGTCSVAGRGLTCDLGTLARNESVSIGLQARTEQEGRVAIKADVSSGTPDPVRANNRARGAIDVKRAKE